MRRKLARRMMILVLGMMLIVIFFGATNMVSGAPRLDDPNPYPEVVPSVNQNSSGATSLILGAAVIMVIIWGGVAFRRRPRS